MNKLINKLKMFARRSAFFVFFILCMYHSSVFSQVTFTDVAQTTNVNNNSPGMGAAWADYNNDGYLDLYVSNYGGANMLYKNNGNGVFSNVSADAGVDDFGNGAGIAWGDCDNDGYPDLYLVNDVGAGYGAENFLYKNNGDGTFADIAGTAGVTSVGYGLCVSWADYDGDGLLDFYLTNNVHTIFCYGQSNKLFRNKGSNLFEDVTESAGVGEMGNSMGVSWCDYDNDGDQDFIVINFASPYLSSPEDNPSVLYRNNGDGTFNDVSSIAGINHLDGGHSGIWGDYDNDGDMDLFITNNSTTISQSPPVSTSGKNVLYRNNNDGTFTEVTDAAGLGGVATSIEATWVDYDNDGNLDLHVVNGGIQRDEASNLYRNNGDGTFADVAETAGVLNTGNGEGAAWGDYDNDGFMDLYVVNYKETNRLYHNNGNDNHWIIIKTIGTTNNRAGIGARIEITTDSGSQIREVDGGSGFCSQDSLWVHFGLGSDDSITTLKITWPNGKTRTLTGIESNQTLEITEE
ncbi:MAG: CRTAC1 family protein [Candidatus Kuenenia sp.]|nr:CRTAC1 family protein [Candidatus Kuenenia sp.]